MAKTLNRVAPKNIIMGIFCKSNQGGLLDDRRKDVKTAKKIIKIATLGIVDTTGNKKNSSMLSKKK